MKLRIVLLVVVLANVLFHVWSGGYLVQTTDGREPERLQKQLDPQKIVVLPPSQQDSKTCRLVGPLSAGRMGELRDWIGARAGLTLEIDPTAEMDRHWVIIPALASMALAEKKVVELQGLGVNGTTVLADKEFGPFLVQIGDFSEVGRARKFFEELNGKGVRSARLVERKQNATSTTARVLIPVAELKPRSAELASWLAEVAAEAPRECPAP